MTSPSAGSDPVTVPSAGGGRPLLRAARRHRGWSQAVAARELSALAARTGVAVAGPASLKTQLSRWENGHAAPEPEYRTLLGTLYDSDAAGLGLAAHDRSPVAAGRAATLRVALTEAEALDGTALALLREQVEATVRLDRLLGPAGAADVLSAQVERLASLADHVLPEAIRDGVCALLAEAALLAGDQERDRDRTAASWSRYGTARAAALEAGRPDLAARARAARAGILVEAGEPERARTLLGGAADEWSALVRSEADATTGGTPTGELGSTTTGWAGDHTGPPRRPPDAIRPAVDVDVEPFRHRANLARAASGDRDARAALERTAGDEQGPVRERAEASAALALALARDAPEQAADHARRAHLLAARIGAPRIAALAARSEASPIRAGRGRAAGPPRSTVRRAQPSDAPARSSSAAR